MTAEEYLRSIKRTREEVDRFLTTEYFDDAVENNKGWTYSAELGWILKKSWRQDGVNGSKTFYDYQEDGARRQPNFGDQHARIHTYGNSFTHCDQVSDGETWQEYLAAHLQEPIRNYGVGGYSVYQAYRRMLHVQKTRPSEYIILNIWSDDHFRNLDSWRSIRFGCFTTCGLPLPHLRVNVDAGICTEHENLCPTPSELYNLCDESFLFETFLDDPVLQATLITKMENSSVDADQVPVSFGLAQADGNDRIERTQKAHAKAALYASQNIVNWTEKYCREQGKQFLLMLSHDRGTVAKELMGEPRWDQSFLNFLEDKTFPIIDMRDHHRADFEQSKRSPEQYLDQFYIGHYSPAGNYFMAQAIQQAVVDWLDPKPAPYR